MFSGNVLQGTWLLQLVLQITQGCRSAGHRNQPVQASPGDQENPDKLSIRVSHPPMSHILFVSWILRRTPAQLRRAPLPLASNRATSRRLELTVPQHYSPRLRNLRGCVNHAKIL